MRRSTRHGRGEIDAVEDVNDVNGREIEGMGRNEIGSGDMMKKISWAVLIMGNYEADAEDDEQGNNVVSCEDDGTSILENRFGKRIVNSDDESDDSGDEIWKDNIIPEVLESEIEDGDEMQRETKKDNAQWITRWRHFGGSQFGSQGGSQLR